MELPGSTGENPLRAAMYPYMYGTLEFEFYVSLRHVCIDKSCKYQHASTNLLSDFRKLLGDIFRMTLITILIRAACHPITEHTNQKCPLAKLEVMKREEFHDGNVFVWRSMIDHGAVRLDL